MSTLVFVNREEDVTAMKTGDRVIIDRKLAVKKSPRGDGVDYLINNHDRTVTVLNLRGYHITDGMIIPVWYSGKKVNLDRGEMI